MTRPLSPASRAAMLRSWAALLELHGASVALLARFGIRQPQSEEGKAWVEAIANATKYIDDTHRMLAAEIMAAKPENT